MTCANFHSFWSLFTIPTMPLLFHNFSPFLTHFACCHPMPLDFARLILMLNHTVSESGIEMPLMLIDNRIGHRVFDS